MSNLGEARSKRADTVPIRRFLVLDKTALRRWVPAACLIALSYSVTAGPALAAGGKYSSSMRFFAGTIDNPDGQNTGWMGITRTKAYGVFTDDDLYEGLRMKGARSSTRIGGDLHDEKKDLPGTFKGVISGHVLKGKYVVQGGARGPYKMVEMTRDRRKMRQLAGKYLARNVGQKGAEMYIRLNSSTEVMRADGYFIFQGLKVKMIQMEARWIVDGKGRFWILPLKVRNGLPKGTKAPLPGQGEVVRLIYKLRGKRVALKDPWRTYQDLLVLQPTDRTRPK
jgi:hypothetical protein